MPCIKGMPSLKALHASYHEHVEFLSVCYDEKSRFDKAKEILNANQTGWPDVFIPFGTENSIIGQMGIDTFPTFILLDKSGEVLFRLSGDGKFPDMDRILNGFRADSLPLCFNYNIH